MQLKESKTFNFEFNVEGVNFKVNLVQETKDEAIAQLKRMLTTILAEVNTTFPSKK